MQKQNPDSSNTWFSVTITTFQWLTFLSIPKNAEIVIHELLRMQNESGVSVNCWIVMPEHCRVVIGTAGHLPEQFIDALMKRTESLLEKKGKVYACRVWRRMYFCEPVETGSAMESVCASLLAAPVIRKLAATPEGYKYSSLNPDWQIT